MVRIHQLVRLPKPTAEGITHRALCQRSFRLETGKQLRGSENPKEVTCSRCRLMSLGISVKIAQ